MTEYIYYRDMQGTSMEGPVPESIALLVNLTSLYVKRITLLAINDFWKVDLMLNWSPFVYRSISDLAGSSIPFPNLQPLTNLEEL